MKVKAGMAVWIPARVIRKQGKVWFVMPLGNSTEVLMYDREMRRRQTKGSSRR